MPETGKTPAKQEGEGKSVLSGKEEFGGEAEQKIGKMGEKTQQSGRDSTSGKPQKP